MQVGWEAGVAAKEREDSSLLAMLVIAGEHPEQGAGQHPPVQNPHTP